MVIAPSDPGPGVENWLDTGGRREGYMLVRWVLADGPPHPSAEVVKDRRLVIPVVAGDGVIGRLGTSWISQPFPSGSLKERKVS